MARSVRARGGRGPSHGRVVIVVVVSVVLAVRVIVVRHNHGRGPMGGNNSPESSWPICGCLGGTHSADRNGAWAGPGVLPAGNGVCPCIGVVMRLIWTCMGDCQGPCRCCCCEYTCTGGCCCCDWSTMNKCSGAGDGGAGRRGEGDAIPIA
jgi:hypothetical protein